MVVTLGPTALLQGPATYVAMIEVPDQRPFAIEHAPQPQLTLQAQPADGVAEPQASQEVLHG